MRTLCRIDTGNGCLMAGYVADDAYFLAADGVMHVARFASRHATSLHRGDILAAERLPGGGLLSAGEDGCLMSASGQDPVCLARTGNKWVSALAVATDGTVAYASGRTVWLQDGAGAWSEHPQARSVEALAFDGTGRRLAMGFYDGVMLHERNHAGPPRWLPWKGIPTRMVFSPDGRFLMIAMRDAALHGWRLDASRHFRMLGYSRPVTDWSWTADGRWLATNGSAGAVLWPFTAGTGPIGLAPVELGARPQHHVTAVACHPSQRWVAVGYSDGAIVLEGLDGDRRKIIGQAGRDALAALAWHPDGTRLAYGSQSGDCGAILIL
ncbi:WD40 repeat domain-containing protein [Bordetella petrii]|uniref:WD40 repeat domain-containing protein n=1 Tax=Bordetella petrii TaxID=94624 RepID=UPI001E5505F4|nr:WD40 repeat domain-containing protein [Bordetella petrii]MCD0504298.1 WD40 repeat domain-containing protein [Bordetella petrii]